MLMVTDTEQVVISSVQACDTYMYINIVYSCTCVLIDRCVKVKWEMGQINE